MSAPSQMVSATAQRLKGRAAFGIGFPGDADTADLMNGLSLDHASVSAGRAGRHPIKDHSNTDRKGRLLPSDRRHHLSIHIDLLYRGSVHAVNKPRLQSRLQDGNASLRRGLPFI